MGIRPHVGFNLCGEFANAIMRLAAMKGKHQGRWKGRLVGRQGKSSACGVAYAVEIIESFRERPNIPYQPFRRERQ
jgi:hypothetical protein